MSEPKIQLCWRNEKDIGTKKNRSAKTDGERTNFSLS